MAHRNDDKREVPAHGEGQHGDKTHEAIIEPLHGESDKTDESHDASKPSKDVDEFGQPHPGHHRLTEHREQHDAAEKNSEANRHGR